jgi:hypothetical protein
MRLSSLIIATIAIAACAFAQQTPTVNFNLVQVNHYHGQEHVTDSIITPGERIVIDLGNPGLTQRFLAGSASEINVAPVVVNVERIAAEESGGVMLPWESKAVLHSISGRDSFLVTSSLAGCPGTEVKPSVSVAFATGSGWSDPPIRFGPLSERGVCALGRGFNLDVSVRGSDPPTVKLREEPLQYGKR